ncbi:hypothetical protein BGW38_001067 [Lunasporangiospora selenospora]|uniref:Uncharacterized protein n=1 Tax=Lunasporangiospora selenospora TaxID=979761 RepID=A0A9P6KDS4_9FUNG|nr:hypothetical protein BGW38_001067 [Lunasporangiospora selenospora]
MGVKTNLYCGADGDFLTDIQCKMVIQGTRGDSGCMGSGDDLIARLLIKTDSSEALPTAAQVKSFIERCDGYSKTLRTNDSRQFNQETGKNACPGSEHYRCNSSQCEAAFGKDIDICVANQDVSWGSDPATTKICFGTETNHYCP